MSRAAHLLGYAGLLPQIAAVVLVARGTEHHFGEALAFGYAGLILSFLGGIWWGFAMRRHQGQGALAAVAVVPSLAVLALGILIVLGGFAAALTGLGIAILATLLVDRRLVASGDAPPDWMSLRAPLSLGLGSLTILAGLLAA
ncbi:DUF3429 domain-containing protein [Sphingomonas lenta]|uniref:DUF3429 domain-containing protein n=1 Tax=Sphingomonas lenta TaxID=1141887 RepID=A0A2A2SEE5_9SPHN|nr:DUF3429 domain-containing protein [Sphingomonas lenta]